MKFSRDDIEKLAEQFGKQKGKRVRAVALPQPWYARAHNLAVKIAAAPFLTAALLIRAAEIPIQFETVEESDDE